MLHAQIIGEGKPLFILHGFLGMSDNWKTLGLKYAENGFQAHLIDQRNHGHSFHSQVFNYSVLAEDLKIYAQSKSIAEFDLIGHSMGGKTAMLFATENPEMVKSLVVADIAPKFYPAHHQDILRGLAAVDFDVITSRSEADKQLALYVSDGSVRQFLLKNLYWETRERLGFRMNLQALTENENEIGVELPKNNIFAGRTLFLKGEFSEYVMPEDTPLIKTHFPNAEIDTVSKSGHWLHAQNPAEFLSKTLQFLIDKTY
ncbi:alpha/beta fold hydrolase [Capnocytophaga sp.]|uniref:alpha/beta fold hydrolase n=1 Tax=Capnocytophaga sp. TaxID=44737 RepID=UPI0026DAA889|nr:alpha/beta fold hydrolase [Capnocytophaga sp.]MDO5105412.1 alpha/beta fold hydrolase [Capnocytophaga sp.]